MRPTRRRKRSRDRDRFAAQILGVRVAPPPAQPTTPTDPATAGSIDPGGPDAP
jgi:hypothetical protein